MLTRFVRTQLIIFAIASVIGVSVLAVSYLQVPLLLGWGRINVTLELPAGGGLYRLANVTYRGSQIGKVTAVDLTPDGARATLTLDPSPPIPADLVAQVRSVSAIGEQYVDLRPRTASGPYLRDGSVIARSDTEIPQPVGPMLDSMDALLATIPKDKLAALLAETSKGLDDAGFDLGSLLDSSATITSKTRQVSPQTQALIEDAEPLLNGQVQTADATRTWARSLANVTDQIVTDDPQVRTIINAAPGALQEVSQLLDAVKPTLPVLLANMTSVGQVGVTYLPSLEQLLVLFPPYLAVAPFNNATGLPLGNFRVEANDPPGCTVGFLPPSQWRSPADTNTIDTPDGLYCKLPQDSPILVRGARNLPCMDHPGKRAPTVDICDSDQQYQPLAMRQHVLGPSPLDPNLIAQGVPLDDRVTRGDNIFGPIEGTPMPGDAPPLSAPAVGPAAAPPIPPPPPPGDAAAAPSEPAPAGAGDPGSPADAPGQQGPESAPGVSTSPPDVSGVSPPAAPPAVPNSATTGALGQPSFAAARYDPRTGRFMAPDGQVFTQTDLVSVGAPRDWRDLVMSFRPSS